MSARLRYVRAVLTGDVADHPLADLADTTRMLMITAITGANIVGAGVVVLLLAFVLPRPPGVAQDGVLAHIGAGGITGVLVYIVLALALGTVLGIRRAAPVSRLFRADRTADEGERRAVLRLPLVLLQVQASIWGVAVLVFGGIAFGADRLLGFEVAITTALGGIPTACLAYLLSQRLVRGGISVVLGDAPPRIREVPGVRPRALLVWALGAVPIGGVFALVGFANSAGTTRHDLVVAVSVLCGVSLAVGVAATLLFARAIAEPLQRLRAGFERVETGDYDVEVPVFDATEVGYATASFNRMASGLRERERLRDLFGRQVGADVARRALDEGVTLGGEERAAAVLFVDVIGSTSFAADRPPREVVDALNAFFDVVVTVTQEHGGLVNKFIGDAALCVFGAPLAADDASGAALAAARHMARRLRGQPLGAGIGVTCGTVVAGNVGTAERYEYTVIGDPVNEAARITELAKDRRGRVLASATAVEAAGPEEATRWHTVDELTLRGRSRTTRLAEPRND